MKHITTIFQWVKKNPYKSVIGITLSGLLFVMQFTNEAYTLKKNIDGEKTPITNSKTFETKTTEKFSEQKIEKEDVCIECEAIYQAGLNNIDQKRLTSP